MKITAMLAFFDEPATQLYQCAKSAGRLADHIVAADGPFRLYPHTKVRSSSVALQALKDGASDGGATLKLIPGREWAGQVEKRDRIMREAKGSDWVFYMDADDRISQINNAQVRAELEQDTDTEVFFVARFTPPNPNAKWKPDANEEEVEGGYLILPRLFRYLDDMRVERVHWGYTATRKNGDRIALWGPAGNRGFPSLLPVAQPLRSLLLFEHLQTWRSVEYRERQLIFREQTARQLALTGAEA